MLVSSLAASAASGFSGTARVGYVLVDDEGNRSVQQPTYNIYEGAALSLEDFDYYSANGLHLSGDLRNITLNNRDLSASLTKQGVFGLKVRNNQYRRIYSAEGDSFTRRHHTNADLWAQVNRNVRLYGGFGLTGKKGHTIDLFEPGVELGRREVDFTQTDYKAGAALKYRQYHLNVEFRGASFSDDIHTGYDRSSVRYEIRGGGPIPNYEDVALYGGFQRYQSRLNDQDDTLIANTVWADARYQAPYQVTVKAGFVFDRARRTGDWTSTDNITYHAQVGKDWLRYGGIVLGYRYRIKDDLWNELRTDSYSATAWAKPVTHLLVRAGYGSDALDVKSGHTLTGDEDRTRGFVSARYDVKGTGYLKVKHCQRNIDNDQIGSSAEYLQEAVELSVRFPEYGELQAAYSLLDGEYVNGGGGFEFKDHVVTGDLLSREYRGFQGGFGLIYMRGKEDVDIETSTLRFTGSYNFMADHQVMVRYNVYNFDDLADPSPIYSRYYTANIVEISVAKRF